MEKVIAAIILVILVLFVIKKNYREILVFLIICFIVDWILIKVFSRTPFAGRIAILVGRPMLTLITYSIIQFISMGVFYYVLRKYNCIISSIVYLAINLVINTFYVKISGNVLLDLVFNLIIVSFIIIAYKESTIMEDIKWFAVIGTVINAISTFFISKIFLIGVGITLFLGSIFMPLIISIASGLVVSAIIIYSMRKMLMKKSELSKVLICVMILFICEFVFMAMGYLFFKNY